MAIPTSHDTSSSSTSDPQQSYSSMSVGDVEAIGAHCQAAFCHQLDFLPFRCESCKGTFCLDHRSETAHACANAGAWARARAGKSNTPSATPTAPKPHILTHESQCSHPSCKTLINTPLVPGIECASCNRSYCLKHRLTEEHDCSKLPPLGARAKNAAGETRVADALSKLRAWGAAKKASASTSTSTSTSSPSSASKKPSQPASSSTSSNALTRIVSPFKSRKSAKTAAATTALMALKRSAKGDAKIPADKRVYVHLEAVAPDAEGAAHARIPRADAFFSTEWSVGRVLDAAAKMLEVRNVNNQGGGEKERLRVFWVEGGRLLAFGEKVSASGVKNGDMLVLLRGVGEMEAAP